MTVPVRRAAIRVALALSSLIALALLLSPATAVSAAEPKTEVKTVPAEVVFEKAQRPGDPGNCSAIVFIKWQDVPNTLSATVYYTYKGGELSATEKAPFHDSFSLLPITRRLTAATGYR